MRNPAHCAPSGKPLLSHHPDNQPSMKHRPTTASTFVRLAALFLAVLSTGTNATAQLTTRVPLSVTTTVSEFNATTTVSNLILDITALTDSNTTFPYETTTQFTSSGIGYISQFGMAAGTLTFTFPQPVSISHLYVWNAYFTIELDHSINQVEMTFRDNGGNVIANSTATVPIATVGDLTAYAIDNTFTVSGVSTVELNVQTLHGGNEISLRRIAFAGPGEPSGLDEAHAQLTAPAFPCPAIDAVTIPVRGAQQVSVFDARGRQVHVEANFTQDHLLLYWQRLAAGAYTARIETRTGRVSTMVVVQ